MAEETMAAIKALKYTTPSGRTLSLDKLVSPAVRRSKLFKPDWSATITEEENIAPQVSVTRESTLEAGARLSEEWPCVLNFASAKHPGGGFMRGAIAQEESIARASALFQTLIEHPEFYEENKRSGAKATGLYTDYAIYSPDVPVIRNDRGDWLEEPYTVCVLTSPAPNRTAILNDFDNEGKEMDAETEKRIENVFRRRIHQVLAIMAERGHRTIVLGAWGCGVFGNDPWKVAGMFQEALVNTPFFDKVVFAIYDSPDSEIYQAFNKVFGD